MTLTVRDVYDRARQVLGACSQTQIFGFLTDAVEVLANTGTFDPLVGYVDLCVDGCVVTVPREVDTILSANINGTPAVGRDMGYRFHLNGLGDFKQACRYQWEDQGLVPTYRLLQVPSKLVAFVQEESDAGKELWVYGFDTSNRWLRTQEGDTWKDGIRVPTIFGYALPDADAQVVARITRVRKAETDGPVRLSSFDGSATTGTLLGVFDADETEPQYRRIRITPTGCWVRLMFRRAVFRIKSQDDVIPLPSSVAVLMMLRAMKYYDEKDIATGTAYEAAARRFLTEAHLSHTSPVGAPPQINVIGGWSVNADQLEP